MHGILEDIVGAKGLELYLLNRVYPTRLFEKFFPFKALPVLNFNILLGEYKNIAASVCAYDASAPESTRQVLSRLTGDIPPIRIKRKMSEGDLNMLLMLKSMGNAEKNSLYDVVFNDVDFVYQAVLNRLEWLALQALSTGGFTLSKTTNAGIVTEDAVDFQIPASHYNGGAVIWSAAIATTTPITDFTAIQAAAKAVGVTLKWALMSPTSFTYFRSSQETIDFAWGRNIAVASKRPNLTETNLELAADGLPEIAIVNSFVDLEDESHTITATQCWSEGKVAFLPEGAVIGRTYTGPLASDIAPNPSEMRSKKGAVGVRSWSTSDPVNSICLGEANALPVIADINRIWLMNSLHASTWS